MNPLVLKREACYHMLTCRRAFSKSFSSMQTSKSRAILVPGISMSRQEHCHNFFSALSLFSRRFSQRYLILMQELYTPENKEEKTWGNQTQQ